MPWLDRGDDPLIANAKRLVHGSGVTVRCRRLARRAADRTVSSMMKRLLATLALMVVLAPRSGWAERRAVIRFIDDDYPRALAEARTAQVPLAVAVWATWCHACRYMETSVFTDRAIAPAAARYRWAHLNADVPANATFLDKHGTVGFPAIVVIDPRDESVVLARSGTATADQLLQILADGQAGYARRGSNPADQALAAADRAYGASRWPEAVRGYTKALVAAGPAWASRGRATEALVLSHLETNAHEACATAAVAGVKALPPSDPYRGQVGFLGFYCALAAKDARAASWRAKHAATLEPIVVAALAQPQVLYDNRGEFPAMLLIEARNQARDAPGVEKTRSTVLATLERIATSAATPEERATAAAVFSFLASPATCTRFLPTLTKLDGETTTDYLPPMALARCLGLLDRTGDALEANTRALARAPRGRTSVRLLLARSRLEVKRGDARAARGSLQRAIELARKVSASSVPELEAELAKLPSK